MGREIEVVLKGRGGVFRLEGGQVRVVRGRTMWEIPLRAIKAVEHGDGRSVRLRVSGGGSAADFSVSSGNRAAVRAFTEGLGRAMAGVVPAPDGQALVSVSVRPFALPPLSSRAARVTAGVSGYLLLVVAVLMAARSPEERALVLFSAFIAPFGGGLLALAWIFFLRDPWILRRRGVTVPGEIVRYVTSTRQQAKYPVYRFTTVEGVTRTQESSVTMLVRRRNPRVDVTYDPQNLGRVRGGRAVGHIGVGFFLGALGACGVLVPLTTFATVVWPF